MLDLLSREHEPRVPESLGFAFAHLEEPRGIGLAMRLDRRAAAIASRRHGSVRAWARSFGHDRS
jgi:hypothetical protein